MCQSNFQVDQQLEIVIEAVGSDGYGIGFVDSKAIFVPFVGLGERVRIRLVHVGRRRIVAQLLDILESCSSRCEPICDVFGRCGGCQLMHLEYDAQLSWKRRHLEDVLRSVAGLNWPEPIEIVPSAALTYRNRGQYPVSRVDSRVATGFYAPRSHRLIPVRRCHIHHQDIDQCVAVVRSWAGRKRVPIYDEQRQAGWLRHIVVRRSHATGELILALVGRHARSQVADLIRLLRRKMPLFKGLLLNINEKNTNVILGPNTRGLWGQQWIEERLFDLSFRLSVGSFFQVNTPQAQQLFTLVRNFCHAVEGTLVDAYCGVGVLAQVLANDSRRVIGIEMVPTSVRDARRSAQQNGKSIEIIQGRVEKVLPRLVAEGLQPQALVLDPPRKGCTPEVLQAVGESRCERIAYVSCHPGTLARDLARLHQLGFRLTTLCAVDMFPQTAHLETFCGLERAWVP